MKQTIEEKNNVIAEIGEKVDTTLDTIKAIMPSYVLDEGMLTEITAALNTLKKKISECEIEENNFDTVLEIIKDLKEEDINLTELIKELPHSCSDILEAMDQDEILEYVDGMENTYILRSENMNEVSKIEDFIRDEIHYPLKF